MRTNLILTQSLLSLGFKVLKCFLWKIPNYNQSQNLTPRIGETMFKVALKNENV